MLNFEDKLCSYLSAQIKAVTLYQCIIDFGELEFNNNSQILKSYDFLYNLININLNILNSNNNNNSLNPTDINFIIQDCYLKYYYYSID